MLPLRKRACSCRRSFLPDAMAPKRRKNKKFFHFNWPAQGKQAHARGPHGHQQQGEASKYLEEESHAVWMRDKKPYEGELEFDPSAYDCMTAFRLEWPCLSVDIVSDDLGVNRTTFPQTFFAVTGTQASRADANHIALLQVGGIERLEEKTEDDEGSQSSDAEESNEEKTSNFLNTRLISHHGGVNRIRAMPQRPSIVATWSESGHVQLWNLQEQLSSLTTGIQQQFDAVRPRKLPPDQVFSGHQGEGFALGWSSVKDGNLASGDCQGEIRLWEQGGGPGEWSVSEGIHAHEGSVEEIVWSPTESYVLASAGSDGCLKIWDGRQMHKGPAAQVHAHCSDVNVADWSRLGTAMVATGCEDGSFRIWDLRRLSESSYVARFEYHQAPVTSIHWAAFESTVLATSSADNQVCFWDLSLERDTEEERVALRAGEAEPPSSLPPQLLFVHRGQDNVKELRLHEQVPGLCVSTAADGFNAFKPANIDTAQ